MEGERAALALPPVCILAGGLGKRLGERVKDTPKPLLEISGQPFLMHVLALLSRHGADEAVLCVGYRGDQIRSLIGSERFGVRIRYSFDSPDLDGTLGAIRKALPMLGERFLVLYGDTYLAIDYAAVSRSWASSGLPAVMTVLRNEGRWDRSNAVFDGKRVVAYDKHAPTAEMRWIDYGLGGLTSTVVQREGETMSDLSDLYHLLAARGALFGYEATNRFYEIGSPSALAETEAYLRESGWPRIPNPSRLRDA